MPRKQASPFSRRAPRVREPWFSGRAYGGRLCSGLAFPTLEVHDSVCGRSLHFSASARSWALANDFPGKPTTCPAPAYRQFDFWLGNWDVFDVASPTIIVAHVRVVPILDGCVLHE